MTPFGNLSEKHEIRPFDGDLPDDGSRPIETSQKEGIDEAIDKKKKKDNRWHSFKTP
jgi:hypothetical protein